MGINGVSSQPAGRPWGGGTARRLDDRVRDASVDSRKQRSTADPRTAMQAAPGRTDAVQGPFGAAGGALINAVCQHRRRLWLVGPDNCLSQRPEKT